MNIIENYRDTSFKHLINTQSYWIDIFKQSYLLIAPNALGNLNDQKRDSVISFINDPDRDIQDSEPTIKNLCLYTKAIGYMMKSDNAKAEQSLFSITDFMGEEHLIFYTKTFYYIVMKDYENSLKMIDEAVRLNPNFAPYHLFRGYLNCFARDYTKCIESCNFVLQHTTEQIEKLLVFKYIPNCIFQAEYMMAGASDVRFDSSLFDPDTESGTLLNDINSSLPEVTFLARASTERSSCIYTMADPVYFKKWAVPMLLSAKQENIDSNYYVHIVNPDQESLNIIDTLSSLLENRLTISIEQIKFENKEIEMCYYVGARFCRLYQFSQTERYSKYLLVDSDILFNRNISGILEDNSFNSAFVYFKDEPIWDSLMGGFCIFDQEGVSTVLKNISNFVLRSFQSDKSAWFLDIIAIFLAVTNEKNTSVLKLLDAETYLDINHTSKSMVWAVTTKKDSFLYNSKNSFFLNMLSDLVTAPNILPESIRTIDPYWITKQKVDKKYLSVNRNDFFGSLCHGKKVLHVGCADYPITNIHSNLHISLDKLCEVDGCDTQTEALELLKPHVSGLLFNDLAEATGYYDLALIPEVIEHVDNVSSFLQTLNSLNTKYFVITVPDAFLCSRTHFWADDYHDEFVELNHPDHNYWFSPYTIKNIIHKYTNWRVLKLAFFDTRSIMVIAEKP